MHIIIYKIGLLTYSTVLQNCLILEITILKIGNEISRILNEQAFSLTMKKKISSW
jgi:hypothetical protein